MPSPFNDIKIKLKWVKKGKRLKIIKGYLLCTYLRFVILNALIVLLKIKIHLKKLFVRKNLIVQGKVLWLSCTTRTQFKVEKSHSKTRQEAFILEAEIPQNFSDISQLKHDTHDSRTNKYFLC